MKNFFLLAAVDPDTGELVRVVVISVVANLVIIGLGMWFYRSWHRYSSKKDSLPLAPLNPETPIPINPAPTGGAVVDAEVIRTKIRATVRIHWQKAPGPYLFPGHRASDVYEVLAKALDTSEAWTRKSEHSSFVLMDDGSLNLQVHLHLDSLDSLPVYDLQIVPNQETVATLVAMHILEHGKEKCLRNALSALKIPENSQRISVLRLVRKGRPRVDDSLIFQRSGIATVRVYLLSAAELYSSVYGS